MACVSSFAFLHFSIVRSLWQLGRFVFFGDTFDVYDGLDSLDEYI